MTMPEITEETAGQAHYPPRAKRRRLWPGVAIAVVIVAVVAFFLAQTGSPESRALAAVERYFEAFNSGDVEATLAFLLDEGGAFNVTTDPADTPFTKSGYDETVGLIAWSVASDTTLSDGECSTVGDREGAIVVTCSFLIDVIHRKVMDLPPLVASLTVSVSDDRFVGFDETIILPINEPGSPIDSYVEFLSETHPEEVELVYQVEWASVEEAVAAGEARARYVDEWSASLNG